jgi:hypothetical protein
LHDLSPIGVLPCSDIFTSGVSIRHGMFEIGSIVGKVDATEVADDYPVTAGESGNGT